LQESGDGKTQLPARKSLRSFLSGRFALALAIGIIAVSYGLFFYLQGIVERDFRDSLFEQQQARQIESTKSVAQHIEADLGSISARLALVASDPAITSGDLGGQGAGAALQDAYSKMSLPSTRHSPGSQGPEAIIDGLFLVNSDGIIEQDVWAASGSIVGTNVSSLGYALDDRSKLHPTFSTGYRGSDDKVRVAGTHPIRSEAGEYLGMAVATMHTKPFFQHYGNIHDIGSQYMAVLDIDSVQLVHPVASLIGTPFFGEHTQNVTGRNEVLNTQIRQVMSGSPGNSLYEFVNGERFNTGHPVFFGGEPTYFVFVITPTSAVYSTSDGILAAHRMGVFTVLAGTTGSIAVLIFLLARWNSGLNREVQSRTAEISLSNSQLLRANSQLEESNRQLEIANEKMIAINEQLERNEKIQKEFINVAAHELRTPIQPILGLAEIMHTKTNDPEMLEIIGTIERSARRLLHLSSDILDTARIEGQGLRLSKENLEINELLLRSAQDYLPQFQRKNLRLGFEPGEKAMVSADKVRIAQVMTNLLSNASKFTNEGSVTLKVVRADQTGEVLVTLRDTGIGIDGDILPRLFTKFATKSEKGTGLGLFISRNIIEAHGGRMWASNNEDGKGATFGFSLPLAEKDSKANRGKTPESPMLHEIGRKN
jgi:signal transduction histidine kinase